MAECIIYLFPPVFTSNFLCLSRLSRTQYAHKKPKRSKARWQYYSNSSASQSPEIFGSFRHCCYFAKQTI